MALEWLEESDNEDTKALRHFTIAWLKELLGEIDRLEKENERLRDDCEVLKNRCTGVYE